MLYRERADALCAAAWVELCAGERAAGEALARDAEQEARATGDRPALAEALALQGVAVRPVAERKLEAAVEIWREVGNVIALERGELALAICHGEEQRERELRERLRIRGVAEDPVLASVAPPATSERSLAILTLGRFAVVRDGQHVGAGQWRSRKARDLLKLLAARRDRPITARRLPRRCGRVRPRGPSATGCRSRSATLRRVLDPERRQPVDHFVMADSSTLVLRAANVGLDVARFLELASEATQLAARDGLLAAEPTLTEAERLYAGDFLEGDLYEDWAVTRGAARSAALEISRLLARGAVQRGDEEAAARHLRGLLERDGYDEDAWLALVGSLSRMRRYGEARRQHMLYARRMAELEIAPVPLTDARDATP